MRGHLVAYIALEFRRRPILIGVVMARRSFARYGCLSIYYYTSSHARGIDPWPGLFLWSLFCRRCRQLSSFSASTTSLVDAPISADPHFSLSTCRSDAEPLSGWSLDCSWLASTSSSGTPLSPRHPGVSAGPLACSCCRQPSRVKRIAFGHPLTSPPLRGGFPPSPPKRGRGLSIPDRAVAFPSSREAGAKRWAGEVVHLKSSHAPRRLPRGIRVIDLTSSFGAAAGLAPV